MWYNDPIAENKTIVTYRFKSVLFGATSSPFLLQATLDTHLTSSNNRYKHLLSQNFYVDNFVGTTNCEQDLLEVYRNANLELTKANMPLQEWVSNNTHLRSIIELDFPGYKLPEVTKILGLLWDSTRDSLILNSPAFVDPSSLSRRRLLSLVSSVFDPLGIFSPVTIRGKLLMREAWKIKVGWDEILPNSFHAEWKPISDDYNRISGAQFPRVIGYDGDICQLHVFCDASNKAYGAVAYLVTNDTCHLVSSKARVVPLKERSIPQLELTALQVGTLLAKYIRNTLKSLFIERVTLWSDNEACLQWVRNDHSKIPYVRNRVAEIRNIATNFEFRHVPTKDNPADLLSRGVSWDTLQKNDIWFTGPSWLCYPQDWPTQSEHVPILTLTTLTTNFSEALFKAEDISSLPKILRITDYVFGFIKRSRPSTHLPTAMTYWLGVVQREHYPEEYAYIINDDKSTPPCLIKSLGLDLDVRTGLLRCRGRLHHSNLSNQTKFPILLPRKSWLTSLVVHEHHTQTFHGGVADTLAAIRDAYWIPKGRQVVKGLLNRCIPCKILEGKSMKLPGPPPLPAERVVYTEPFQTVGVDYSGAITITNSDDNVPKKFYVCLFTCATTRAVHLELARDMSATTFLQLFRRFVARRSTPRIMISDNGTNFTATSKFLRELYNNPEVKSHLHNFHVEWKFLPPRAPWMGGFYERLIGVVKNCIRKVLYKKRITEDELMTILTEVEMRVNNRPITYMSDDLDSISPLTPSHLLYGRRLNPMPTDVEDKEQDPDYIDTKVLNKRYSYLCKILKHWEKVWHTEYLLSLREKCYGAQEPTQSRTPKVGDVVLIDTGATRTVCPLGRVTAVFSDKVGNIRVVEVFSKGNKSRRTINHLVPLEIECSAEAKLSTPQRDTTTARQRTQRQAAKDAVRRIHQLGDHDLL